LLRICGNGGCTAKYGDEHGAACRERTGHGDGWIGRKQNRIAALLPPGTATL
jgi:hypothetical protein